LPPRLLPRPTAAAAAATTATVVARAGKKQGGGWLGGLPSWPNRGADDEEEDEEEDDNSMRPINEVLGEGSSSDEGSAGNADPLACLVVGLSAAELERLRFSMHAIDADIVRLIPCPRAALETPGPGGLTLEEAVSLPQCPAFEPPPDDLPGPVVFLSGMSGPEVAEIVHCYRETQPQLPRAAFCALVPGNRAREVRELVDSVWRDERRVMERRRMEMEQQGEA
jgi:hypothetical protein